MGTKSSDSNLKVFLKASKDCKKPINIRVGVEARFATSIVKIEVVKRC